MTLKANGKFRVTWGVCGDYDDLEETFESEGMARNFYDSKIKEENTWIEIVKILKSRGCDQL